MLLTKQIKQKLAIFFSRVSQHLSRDSWHMSIKETILNRLHDKIIVSRNGNSQCCQ